MLKTMMGPFVLTGGLVGCAGSVTVPNTVRPEHARVGATVTEVHRVDGSTERLPEGYRVARNHTLEGEGGPIALADGDTITQQKVVAIGETTPSGDRVVRKANMTLVGVGLGLLGATTVAGIVGAAIHVNEDAQHRGGFTVGSGGVIWMFMAPPMIAVGSTGIGLLIGGLIGGAAVEHRPRARLTPIGLPGGGGLLFEHAF